MWDCNFSIAFLYASTTTTTWDLEKREPTWSFSLWFCWLSCTSGMHFLSNPELSCSHAVSLWSAPFPDVADWSFIVVCPWLCREILLCCRVTTSIFFQVRKENEEEEEERKNPRVDCIESQNQHHAVAEIPSSLWCLPPPAFCLRLEPVVTGTTKSYSSSGQVLACIHHHSVPSPWGESSG